MVFIAIFISLHDPNPNLLYFQSVHAQWGIHSRLEGSGVPASRDPSQAGTSDYDDGKLHIIWQNVQEIHFTFAGHILYLVILV